jgi:hypothetical protein
MRDAKMLSEARHEAFALVEGDPELAHRTYGLFKQLFGDTRGEGADFADVA